MNRKTILAVSALLSALVVFTACHRITPAEREQLAAEQPAVISEPFPEAAETEAPAQDTAADPEATLAPEPESDRTPEDVEAPRDILTLSIDELVAARDGTDGTLPFILLDCAGAEEINDDIDGRFGYMVGEEYCRLHYEVFKADNDRILSIVVVSDFDDDFKSYMPYVLDLAEGRWLSGNDLLAILAVSPEALQDAELDIMRNEFEYEFGTYREDIDAEFYDEILEKTTSPANAELERIWLGDLGRLMFVARIYGVAGAEFYEYPMSAGYTFP